MYGSFAINNRAPTASELECANPAAPCLLPTNLASDPPLKQVVSKTSEIGARGTLSNAPSGKFSWDFDIFPHQFGERHLKWYFDLDRVGFLSRTSVRPAAKVWFRLAYQSEKSHRYYFQFSHLKATFRSAFLEPSPSNPRQDGDGNIQVNAGDVLPLIPKARVKLGADILMLPHWSVGGTLSYVSPSFYRGDEANLNPELPSYTVTSLRTSYQLAKTLAAVRKHSEPVRSALLNLRNLRRPDWRRRTGRANR